ncbi:nucleoside triphosphate pyrophosphohydrolase [Schleiferia thermophila str. Yellowstone]|uniref:nucleoside triphosphate pyrophosphohydrolase n=1 Tax=Schleiferia thermophila TaxID=884107 RepID=UPI0004E638B9|nr:nucleoside triphosphate pyrophosphohydrolase [Schleiferia thermophila]KFD40137.1 nucleoside triphosphate pyrophosphohydrolase [Schleiferia thermophila str. Yellowstone]
MNSREDKLKAFDRLLTIMDELREQCPWDRKQTMESLRHLTIEETYELADAILEHNMDDIKKEIGDLMLHMVFYARIASESGHFDIADVLNTICDKLIARHPHIYGDVKVSGEEEVKANWEKLKLKEGNRSVLEGVPKSLPAMVKAQRIQEKARGAGFDWDNAEQVWTKVQEELEEFQSEVHSGNHEKMENEFGDLLFSLINYARFLNINPENALEKTNKKFIHRFTYMEKAVQAAGHNLHNLTLAEMDKYWEQAKNTEQ